MKRAVIELTNTFLTKSKGDEKQAAILLSNFLSQRLLQAFIYKPCEFKTPAEKFGCNTLKPLLPGSGSQETQQVPQIWWPCGHDEALHHNVWRQRSALWHPKRCLCENSREFVDTVPTQ